MSHLTVTSFGPSECQNDPSIESQLIQANILPYFSPVLWLTLAYLQFSDFPGYYIPHEL